jgi:hypothetical protein
VVDVRRETGIRFRVIERLAEKDFLDRLRCRFNAPRPSQVLAESLPDEVAQRRPTGSRRVGRPAVQVTRQEKLSSVHV